MKKLFSVVILICFITQMVGIRTASADKIDILIKRLEEKGLLTKDEAIDLKLELAEEEKEERVKKSALPDPIPDWVKNTKLKGDFRARYQNLKRKGSSDRGRARYRLRLATETKLNDKLWMYFGLASGGTGNARSTNQTADNSFDKRAIILDLAYGQYKAAPWFTFLAGKMKNPLWEPGDLVWDTDITPEGAAFQYNKKLTSMVDFFTNAGVFMIDESSSTLDEPTLFAAQPGVIVKLGKASLKTGLNLYNFSNVKGMSLDLNSSSNTYTSGTILKYGYKSIFPVTELSIKKPLESIGIDLPYLAFFGEFIHNPRAETSNNGHMFGAKLGYEKVEDFGQWQLKYNFARLGKDAIPDILPDSDRYDPGKANIRSHEGVFEFGLSKNTWLSLDYYYTENLLAKPSNAPEHLWQIDWNMKF